MDLEEYNMCLQERMTAAGEAGIYTKHKFYLKIQTFLQSWLPNAL